MKQRRFTANPIKSIAYGIRDNMPSNRPLVNPRQTWGERARARIDSTLIVERFQRVALGLETATQTEITAGRILLDKTLPSIAPVVVQQSDGGNAKTITNNQLLNLIEGESKRVKDD